MECIKQGHWRRQRAGVYKFALEGVSVVAARTATGMRAITTYSKQRSIQMNTANATETQSGDVQSVDDESDDDHRYPANTLCQLFFCDTKMRDSLVQYLKTRLGCGGSTKNIDGK